MNLNKKLLNQIESVANSLYQVGKGEARPITLREFLRLKPGDKVLFGWSLGRLDDLTFTGHSEKHPRSWFKFEEAYPGNELHWSYLYVWTTPERDEIRLFDLALQSIYHLSRLIALLLV